MNETGTDPIGGFNLTRENITGSVPAENDAEIIWFFVMMIGFLIIVSLGCLGAAVKDGVGESNCSHAILQFRRTEQCFQ